MNLVSNKIFNNLQEFQNYLVSSGFCGFDFSDFNCVFLLYGDIGQGKTTFVSNFVNSLDGFDPIDVTSPTFNIVHEYKSSLSIFHFDLYRINPTMEKLQEIGLFFALDSHLTFIEWSEKLPESFVNSFLPNTITSKKVCLKLLINKSTIEIIV